MSFYRSPFFNQNLNKESEKDFEKIYGISSTFSKRIIKF